MDDKISERGTKSIKFLDTSIKLEIDYFMYQLVHRILERKYKKQDILQNFLNFFNSETYEIEFKYRIRNFSFPSFEFFKDNHLDIIFEKASQTFIKIRLKEKIWDASQSKISKLDRSNIIGILSRFFLK
ncbi:hypothetical protein [Candidatus Nitrosocosmicus sp. SS]|jgi:hypothetical protein|uniref:hypothetical protein n=1 Tax=Candidatus Nitrosocosmicus agrestis TaxID=2563600 RepID=UPI00122DDD99|nr:hypothetical protein [Candidatus Nitrosocosmicus sp. SS]KAA2279061.1 hypothetical protein F1Z66_14380 [Candidatus Nitrosocosmicus sp. SS]KAF0867650.1 hypothetical protein E5N71_14235 [Candidatus Nitrosocosmicus sp. SS]